MSSELERLRQTEAWIAWVRLGAVVFAVLNVGVVTTEHPPGYEKWAWITTAAFGVGAIALFAASRGSRPPRAVRAVGLSALALDTAVVFAYMQIYSFEVGVPTWGLVYIPIVEAALRYGIRGGVVLSLLTAPVLALIEVWRSDHFPPLEYDLDFVILPAGLCLVMGLIVGWLVDRLRRETTVAESRAGEAESLRDQLGRRADQLEAVNRCGRALGSSLDLQEAFELFLREARSVVEFDRLAIALADGGLVRIMAASEVEHGRPLFEPDSPVPIDGLLIERVLEEGQTIVRADLAEEPRYPEEDAFVAAGLRSRVAAPLAAGGRRFGVLSVARREPDAFSREEIDLITLLGRQLGTAVQNIHVFEVERNAADELRRLSALRADFVSLVSHELRGPMASVIGCAATLRQRWRELDAGQRESFLALIEEETTRLANLVADVLDTSRVDAGSFPYDFTDVDLEEVVREAASVVGLGQSEVSVEVDVAPLPTIRGDRERLRQLLLNLIGNAVKYTVSGDTVEVTAGSENGAVTVRVTDHGPGIAAEEQRLIFEKFGRVVPGGKGKPGAGLGLFIARSIAEAHGGSLDVVSQSGTGATFVLRLPAGVSG